MHADDGVVLRTLGAVQVQVGPPGSAAEVVLPSKALALFAYLAVSRPGGFHRRDLLLSWFWPELEHGHARVALNKHVHLLRSLLGERLLVRRGEDVAVPADAIACDACELERAAAEGRQEHVCELYGGELLPGVSVPGSTEFSCWLDAEREHYRRLTVHALLARARGALRSGEGPDAVANAERAVEVAGLSETVLREAVLALLQADDAAAALRLYRSFERRLGAELGTRPSPPTEALAREITYQLRPEN